MIDENIKKLQELMKEKNVGVYIIPTSDFHSSEYIAEYFKSRVFMSGFTGSAGTMLITQNKSYLFTDGRYFIQAEKQIKGTSIILEKMGEPNVPTLFKLIDDLLKDKENIGFDGRLVNYEESKEYQKLALKHHSTIVSLDLIDAIWKNRPTLPNNKVFIYDLKYTGETSLDKIRKIRNIMKEENAKYHLITSLDDIAYLLNLRGNDISYNPVFLSYLLIEEDKVTLFIEKNKLEEKVKKYLKENKIAIEDYFSIDEAVSKLNGSVLLDPLKVNYYLVSLIKSPIIFKENPAILMKAIKNDIEIQNQRNCLIKDGVAVTKFMYWLKTNIGKIPLSEVIAQNKLYQLREEQKDYLEPSFNTICAYQEHGAMMHYSADEKSDIPLKNKGLLLVDSGGQYLDGTTDITRTFALGKLNEKEKHHFTLVLQSSLNLMNTIFLKGCSGFALDYACREPIWKEFIDYKCGTGHGVGYLLNVHESPNGFRYHIVKDRNDSHEIVPNMITTDEPGVYLENQYGIRIENELLCKEIKTNEFGTFYGFENITIAPIDIDAIDPSELSKENLNYLNNYHKMVYETLSPYLSEDEKKWLKEYTKPLLNK